MAATQLTLLATRTTKAPPAAVSRRMAAQGMPKVSKNGKTYTFTIKKGFKFCNGKPVTSANYKRAFDRGSEQDHAVAGVVVPRRRPALSARTAKTFIVTLKKVAPDFLARMSMMFFAAVPVSTPFTAEGIKAPVVSAGPYYLKEWNAKTSALMVRNPFWKNNVEPFKSLGYQNNLDQVKLDRRRRSCHAAAPVREGRGRPLQLPARAGEGALRQVRSQQEPVLRQAPEHRSGTSR